MIKQLRVSLLQRVDGALRSVVTVRLGWFQRLTPSRYAAHVSPGNQLTGIARSCVRLQTLIKMVSPSPPLIDTIESL